MSIDSKYGYNGADIDAANTLALNKSIQELIDGGANEFDTAQCVKIYEALKVSNGVIYNVLHVLDRDLKRHFDTMETMLDKMRSYVDDLVTCDDKMEVYVGRRFDMETLINTNGCHWLINDLEFDIDLDRKISNLQDRINLTLIRFVKTLRAYIGGSWYQ